MLVDRADGTGDDDEQEDEDADMEEFPTPSASRPHKSGPPEPAAPHSASQAGRPVVPVTAAASGPSWASMAKSLATDGGGSGACLAPFQRSFLTQTGQQRQ